MACTSHTQLASNGEASTTAGMMFALKCSLTRNCVCHTSTTLSTHTGTLDKLITPEEERLFCAYYQHKAQEICATALPNFPRKVAATAVTYVKRYYMTRSLLDQHPAVIMLTAIYLAGKVQLFRILLM